jgi:IS5 family transposase
LRCTKTKESTATKPLKDQLQEVCRLADGSGSSVKESALTADFSENGHERSESHELKLHLITNHLGEIVSFAITKGNVSDQNLTQKLSKNLRGFLFGDKGYLSAKTTAELLKHGLHLTTKVRQNMTNDAAAKAESNLQLVQLKNKNPRVIK